jgi:hypothetical protein
MFWYVISDENGVDPNNIYHRDSDLNSRASRFASIKLMEKDMFKKLIL